jgi:type IV secretory pathway VirB2 component (pilin)
MKKMTKTVLAILIIMMLMTVTTNVFAVGTEITPKSIDGKGSTVNVGGITSIGNDVVRIISTIGVVVSVIVLVVLGIKYMMGSAEEKAEYKKTLMPYIIGAGLVFAASAIATVVYNFASSVNIA